MSIKSITVKKVYSVCFLGLMMILSMASVFLFIKNHRFIKSSDNAKVVNSSDSASVLQEYTLEENEEKTSTKGQLNLGFVDKYWDFVHYATDKTEEYLLNLNPLSSKFQKIQSNFSNLARNDIVFNGSKTFIQLSNGYLAECFDYSPSPKSLNSISDFSTWLKSIDIPYLTLITPDKSDDSITVFPKGIPHGYTKTLNEYKAFLDGNGLEYIELKQKLLAKNDDFYSWFYKTDHHWNVKAAFLAARETAGFLNDEMSIPTDIGTLNDENFKLTVYQDGFLGYFGRKLGYTQKENMEILYPKTATDFHIEIPGYGIDKTGSFEKTLIDKNSLETDTKAYSAFLYDDYPIVRIENKNCQNGTKILVIKYSFANSLCPYLANTVQYLDMIDPRYFDGSIRSYIEQTKPDAVILCTGVVNKDDEENLTLK